MRIIFIGTGEIGVPALESLFQSSDHSIVGVVTQPDKPVGRKQEMHSSPIKRLAMSHGALIFQPVRMRAAEAIEAVKSLQPELIVVMAYGQILPGEVLHAPTVACLNLHASLLPRHRGAAPIQAAIESGDRETGITVMHVAEGLDTGDILLREAIPIRRRETGGSLHDRLAAIAPAALFKAMELLRAGSAPRVAQDSTFATYASKLNRDSGLIDWSVPCVQIDRKIRAMNPWPTAFAILPEKNGHPRKLKVFSAILKRKTSGPPGEVLETGRHGILVAAGAGALLLREVQLEGKKRMSARDFLLGNPVQPGTTLNTRQP